MKMNSFTFLLAGVALYIVSIFTALGPVEWVGVLFLAIGLYKANAKLSILFPIMTVIGIFADSAILNMDFTSYLIPNLFVLAFGISGLLIGRELKLATSPPRSEKKATIRSHWQL